MSPAELARRIAREAERRLARWNKLPRRVVVRGHLLVVDAAGHLGLAYRAPWDSHTPPTVAAAARCAVRSECSLSPLLAHLAASTAAYTEAGPVELEVGDATSVVECPSRVLVAGAAPGLIARLASRRCSVDVLEDNPRLRWLAVNAGGRPVEAPRGGYDYVLVSGSSLVLHPLETLDLLRVGGTSVLYGPSASIHPAVLCKSLPSLDYVAGMHVPLEATSAALRVLEAGGGVKELASRGLVVKWLAACGE